MFSLDFEVTRRLFEDELFDNICTETLVSLAIANARFMYLWNE
jgi:hypothetical protein